MRKSDEQKINENWKIILKDGKNYWYNSKSDELIWIHPNDWKQKPKDVSDWRPMWSRSKKKWYWYNTETFDVSWLHPNVLQYVNKNRKLSNKSSRKYKKGKQINRTEGKDYSEKISKKKKKIGKSSKKKIQEAISRPIEVMDLIREGSNETSSNSSKGSRSSRKRKRTKKK
jgi:hypothetical protein